MGNRELVFMLNQDPQAPRTVGCNLYQPGTP